MDECFDQCLSAADAFGVDRVSLGRRAKLSETLRVAMVRLKVAEDRVFAAVCALRHLGAPLLPCPAEDASLLDIALANAAQDNTNASLRRPCGGCGGAACS